VSGQLNPATHSEQTLLYWARLGPADWQGHTISIRQNRRRTRGKQQKCDHDNPDNSLFHVFLLLVDFLGFKATSTEFVTGTY
jgi:hypothetical protein